MVDREKTRVSPSAISRCWRPTGPRHHSELLAPFGLDAPDASFWQGGLGVIERTIEELEAWIEARRKQSSSTADGLENLAVLSEITRRAVENDFSTIDGIYSIGDTSSGRQMRLGHQQRNPQRLDLLHRFGET